MKIRFLGTSHGVPTPGRHCQSILIETDKGACLIDAGAPVMDILINDGYDLNKIKAIFVTHMHSDHMSAVPDIVCLASWYYTDMSFKVYLPEQRGIDAIRDYCAVRLFGEYKKDYEDIAKRITYHLFSEGAVYDDGGMKVSAFPTEHMYTTTGIAYGFLVEADGKKVYVTGDMHSSLKDFGEFLYEEKVDLLITECAHFDPVLLCGKLKKCKADTVAVIHVFPPRRYDELKNQEKELGLRMIYPKDGDEYEL